MKRKSNLTEEIYKMRKLMGYDSKSDRENITSLDRLTEEKIVEKYFLNEQEEAAIRRLNEQQTGVMYNNKTYDSILVTNAAKSTDNKVATQIETDADVVFLGSVESLKPVRQYYAFSSDSEVYMLPIGSDYMLILGKIGKFETDKMGEPEEIYDIKYRAFYVIHGGNNLRIMQQFDTPANYQQLIKTLADDYQKRTNSDRDVFWNTYADGLFSLYTNSGIVIGKPEFYKNGKSAAIS